jgi:hypothetical protein
MISNTDSILLIYLIRHIRVKEYIKKKEGAYLQNCPGGFVSTDFWIASIRVLAQRRAIMPLRGSRDVLDLISR